jgi:class 3 adenylate cyclase
MSDEPSGAGVARPPDGDPGKERLRLARRVARLEANLRQLEDIRDTNARLLDRLTVDLEAERARSQALLLNVLPQRIVDRLNAGEQRIADRHDDVAVLFSDFVDFTRIAGRLPVADLVAQLGALFAAFDAHCEALGVEKIKTIGDAYLAAAGLPGSSLGHVAAAADLALAMCAAVQAAGPPWQVRIGIHVGPVVAGVIGTRKFAYDLWGDTVNVASRLESTSLPGRIQVSQPVAQRLDDEFVFEARGHVALKGKGATETFFLLRRRP